MPAYGICGKFDPVGEIRLNFRTRIEVSDIITIELVAFFLLQLCRRTVATAFAENCKKPVFFIFFLALRQMALALNIEDLPTQNRGAGT